MSGKCEQIRIQSLLLALVPHKRIEYFCLWACAWYSSFRHDFFLYIRRTRFWNWRIIWHAETVIVIPDKQEKGAGKRRTSYLW